MWQALLDDALCVVIYGPLGVALWALVRNQVGLGNLAPAWFGALLITTYAVVPPLAGTRITMRRDLV